MSTAAQIVQRAIAASGLGEAWCVGSGDGQPDAVRVGDQLLVVEADPDTYGTLLTKYMIHGGEATPVEAVGVDDGGVRTLTSWLRESRRPLTWTREKPGLYRSGEYLVGQLDTGEWFGEGPGVDQCFDHKAQAQAACDAARGSYSPQGVIRPRSRYR